MKKSIVNFFSSIILVLSTAFLLFLPVAIYSTYNVPDDVSNVLKVFNLENKLEPKYQKISGPCWAFASMATLETTLAKKGILDGPLSEKHLLNWCNRNNNESGFHINMAVGGFEEMASAYLAAGAGPYKEKQCPYNTFDCHYNNINSDPLYSVRGIKSVSPDKQSIKDAISSYGAVCAGYNTPGGRGHGVSIIGWDDSKQMWLVKDSGRNNYGYDWLSFNTEFFDCRSYTDVKRYDNKEKIYQYDEFGSNNFLTANYFICSNVFDFNKGDVLDSIMLNTISPGSQCNVYLAKVDSTGRPIGNNPSQWRCVKRNYTIPYKGYCTFSTEKVQLEGRTAVIIEMSGAREASIGLAENTGYGNLKIFSNNTKNCYRLVNGRFLNPLEDNFFNENFHAYAIKAIVKKR